MKKKTPKKKVEKKGCIYDVCWHGPCGKAVVKGTDFCKQHTNVKCYVTDCVEPAVGDCHSHAGPMICGAPMCPKHQHKHHW